MATASVDSRAGNVNGSSPGSVAKKSRRGNSRHSQAAAPDDKYIRLMRAAAAIFEPAELERLAPRTRANSSRLEPPHAVVDPIGGTEEIAYSFLAKGGKHSRPFITLAVYDALCGTPSALSGGVCGLAALPDAVKRAALSIETFHKASLVHDDIEDDDRFRYGDETVHRRWGVPTAVNVGDYLIGLGYRLVSREAPHLGPGTAADILDRLADAHMRLAEGQGAELLWRDGTNKRLAVIDALNIYALKTAPAFEVALYTGARLAGAAQKYVEPFAQFARHLGVAFQILNDLADWAPDRENKLSTGGDVMHGRPTVLWALAVEALSESKRRKLDGLVTQTPSESTLAQARSLYQAAGVFEKANLLVDKHRQRAEAAADEVEPDALRRLLYYLIDTVLHQPTIEPAVAAIASLASPQPIG